MPKWSRYKLLLADDDELAELARGAGSGPAARGPRLADWDPVEELRAELRDTASRIEAAIANANRPKGKQPIRPKPAARPLTAAQRADRRADYTTHLDIVAKVLPRG